MYIYIYSNITMEIVISESKKPDKKFVRFDNKKTVSFGEKEASDFKNIKINNEQSDMLIGTQNEDWTKSGVKAAGWMSKHVLWNKPTLHASVADTNRQIKS